MVDVQKWVENKFFGGHLPFLILPGFRLVSSCQYGRIWIVAKWCFLSIWISIYIRFNSGFGMFWIPIFDSNFWKVMLLMLGSFFASILIIYDYLVCFRDGSTKNKMTSPLLMATFLQGLENCWLFDSEDELSRVDLRAEGKGMTNWPVFNLKHLKLRSRSNMIKQYGGKPMLFLLFKGTQLFPHVVSQP